VATPSDRQVTRKIYRESMGRWRAYGDALAPVQPVLAPFVEAFGYPPD
jgi:uridine kinase